VKAPKGNGRRSLDGFRFHGSNCYIREGFGGRRWIISREHGCFAVRLEATTRELQELEPEIAQSCVEHLVDDRAESLGAAVVLARVWDERFGESPGKAAGMAAATNARTWEDSKRPK
jgi:hypothetical protein